MFLTYATLRQPQRALVGWNSGWTCRLSSTVNDASQRVSAESTNSSSSQNQTHPSTPITEALRHAQASEIFRKSYLFGQRAQNRISVSDIDDLIVASRARPSILLGLLQLSGTTLGIASRVLPKDCGKELNQVVQEATVQQFNDIIREMQGAQQREESHNRHCEDAKETIKYHRDLDAINVTGSLNEKSQNVTIAATTALYNLLKLSKTL